MNLYIRWGLRGALLGLLIGLLVVFIQFVQSKTGTPSQGFDAAVVMESRRASEYSPYFPKEHQSVLRRIAVAQAMAGDKDGASKTIQQIKDEEDPAKDSIVQDSVRNEIVDALSKDAVRAGLVKEKNFEIAQEWANSIKSDNLIKADALGRIAWYQANYHSADAAKEHGTNAFKAATSFLGDEKARERLTPPSTRHFLALWPAGLAVFGLLIGLLFAPCLEAFFSGTAPAAAPAAKAEEEDEEEEEEEEDEEEAEEEKPDEALAAEAMAEPVMEATPIAAPAPPPAPAPAPAPAAAAPARPATAVTPAGSMLQRPGSAPGVPGGAPSAKATAMSPQAKATVVAPQAQPTKLAPPAAATKLAPRAVATQLAPPEELKK